MRPIPADLPAGVLGMVLYGSRARGDADWQSDTDVCVFVVNCSFHELLQLRTWASQALSTPVTDVAVYPEVISREMSDRGSLLLWHLKLEGLTLFERDRFVSDLFTSLRPFHAFKEECDEYANLLGDVESAIAHGDAVTELDLHVLQMIARNACILLCYAHGCPTFGRTAPVQVAMRFLPELGADSAHYELLTNWHLTYIRGSKPPGELPSGHAALEHVRMVTQLLANVRQAVC